MDKKYKDFHRKMFKKGYSDNQIKIFYDNFFNLYFLRLLKEKV